MGAIEVLSLGNGTAAAALSSGVAAATSFAIIIDGHPAILVGCGAGTLRSLYHYLGVIPSTIIILSNTLEQTAELPLLYQTEVVEKGRRLTLFGATQEAVDTANALLLLYFPVPAADSPQQWFERICGRDSGQQTQLQVSSFAAASSCPSGQTNGVLNATADRGQGCGSLVVYFRDRPAVSFTGPTSGLTAETLLWLAQSPTVVCWVGPVNVFEPADRVPLTRILKWFASYHSSTVGSVRHGDLNTSSITLGGMLMGARSEPLLSHCVLAGWGTAADEPVALSMPHFASLAPQGALLAVLVGDFVQSGMPNASQLRSQKETQPYLTSPPASGHQDYSSPPSLLPSPAQQQLLPQLQAPTPRVLTPKRASVDIRASDDNLGSPSSASGSHGYLASAMRPSLSSVNISTSTSAPVANGVSSIPQPERLITRQASTPDIAYNARSVATPGSAATAVSSARAPPQSLVSSAAAAAPSRTSFVDIRKVKVFSNDNKGHEGKVFVMKNFRQLAKFNEAVAMQLNVRPLASIVFADGRKLASLEELPPDCHLIAIRRGGAPYDVKDMPRGVSR